MLSFKEFINEEQSEYDSQYEKFFQKKMDQWGIDSPDELSDEKKEEFFDEIDKEWVADDET